MRFPDRERHQIYLEPEGLDVDEIYVNGFSMSLPAEPRSELVHALPGLRGRVMMRPGTQSSTISCNRPNFDRSRRIGVGGLFFAGQINGTSGYEEAAAQGLVAGINAVSSRRERPPFELRRDEAVHRRPR